MSALRLIASEASELPILASALQDAVVQMKTLRLDRDARSFELMASRYRHEADGPERTLAGLRIDGVTAARVRGLDRNKPESFAVLLDMAFAPGDAPGGVLSLTFAGGGEIALDIEAVDLILADVGEARRVKAVPDHDL